MQRTPRSIPYLARLVVLRDLLVLSIGVALAVVAVFGSPLDHKEVAIPASLVVVYAVMRWA